MESNVARIRRDFETIEKALGRGPEFQKAHVYAGIGWGIAGAFPAAPGAYPMMLPRSWGSARFIALIIGLPSLLSKGVAGKWVIFPFDNSTVVSGSLGMLATAIIAPLIMWWFA